MTTNIQSFAGDVKIDNGNLLVKSLEVKDNITKLASNNSSFSNVGILMTRKSGASNVALIFNEDGSNVLLGYTNNKGGDDRVDMLTNATANLVVYGNVYVTGSFVGDGASLTGLVTDLQSVTEFGGSTDQTIAFTNQVTGINVSSNVLVSGNVTANVYYGDGGLLSNITQTLEGITAIGNTTPYTIEFTNALNSLVTSGNVGVSNTLPTADLCVGANVVIDDTNLNKINVTGNVACHQLNLGSIEILPAYSLEQVTGIGNTTTNTMSFNNSTLAFDTQKMAGIGIIPSSADVGVSGLHVDGHLRLGGEAENTDEEQMYIKSAGALGVLANHSDTNNTNTELRLQSGDTYNSNITMVGKSSAQYMTFGTNTAERMRIDSSGRVGIGTTNPGYTLDVRGTSNAATYYQNGVELYAQRRWEVDLTGQSSDNFYPVELKHPQYEGSPDLPDLFPVHFKVFGESIGDSDPYNENTLVGYARGGGWSNFREMYDVHYRRYDKLEKRFEGLYKGTQDYSTGIVIYMRGGYRYSVLTDATQVNTYTSAQTLANSVFAIKDVDGADVSGTSANISRLVHLAETNEAEKRFMSGNLQLTANLNVDGTTFHVDATTNRVGVGTTNPLGLLHISSGTSGDCNLILEADTDNNNEGDNPSIIFKQDGTLYEGMIGLDSVNNLHLKTAVGNGGAIKFSTINRDENTIGGLTSNAVERMTITNTGYVGIGTTNPTSNLHVVGTAAISSNLAVSGNVGINTSTTLNRLHLNTSQPYIDGVSVQGGNDVQMIMGNRHSGVSSGTIQVFAGVPSSQPTTDSTKYTLELNPLGGGVLIGNAAVLAVTSTSNVQVASSNLFVDTQSGRVGIGLTNPEAPLHIEKVTAFTGPPKGHATTEFIRLIGDRIVGQTYGISAGIKLGGDTGGTATADGRLEFYLNYGAAAANDYGDIPDRMVMTLRGDGYVGIGTTDPRTALEVNGLIMSISNSTIYSHNLYYDGGWKYAQANYGGSYMRMENSELQFWNAPNDNATGNSAATVSQRMTIDESGNVGIGVGSNITYKLNVNGQIFLGSPGLKPAASNLLYDLDDDDAQILFYKSTYENWAGMGCDSGGSVWIKAGTTGQGGSVSLNSYGRFAIGKQNAQALLEVNNIRETPTLYNDFNTGTGIGTGSTLTLPGNVTYGTEKYTINPNWKKSSVCIITYDNANSTSSGGVYIYCHATTQQPFYYLENSSTGSSQIVVDVGESMACHIKPVSGVTIRVTKCEWIGYDSRVIIKGHTPDIVATDPSTNNYAQLEIQSAASVLGTTTTNPVNLQLGAYHGGGGTVGCGFIQGVCDYVYPSPVCLQPRGGNVGIGLTDPGHRLHVRDGTIQLDGTDILLQVKTTVAATAARIGSTDGILEIATISTTYGSETVTMQSYIDQGGQGDYSDDTRNLLSIQPYVGRVGIGKTDPGVLLDVNGDISCTSLTETSDDRIKYNEEDVSNALTLITYLKPQKYEKIAKIPQSSEGVWIPTDAEWENVKNDYEYENEFGFIAQDVRNVPQLSFLVKGEEMHPSVKRVSLETFSNLTTIEQNTYTLSYQYKSNIFSQDEYSNLTPENQDLCETCYTKEIETQTPLSLNYTGIFVLAVAAIQELKAKNDALETQLASVLSRLDALESS